MRVKLPILGLLAALVLQAPAAEFVSTNIYRITADQTVTDEQWVMASAAETEGTFQNDLFIACGGPITLNGTYAGNIWGLSGGDSLLSGTCDRNVRLTGKSIRIDGRVDGNIMVMAETVILTTNSVVEGNARLAGSSIIMEGTIRGRTSITAGRLVTLGGSIENDARVVAPDILFSRGTHITGNLAYTANKELIPAEGVVDGKIERITLQRPPIFSADRLASRFLWFLAAFLAGVPFIAFFPMTTAMASQLTKKAPWKCLLVGLLASMALPIVGIMCASSIVGIPLATLLLGSWGCLLYLSRIIVGLVLGSAILRPTGASIGRVLLSMALGLSIIYFATLFPAIGLPVQFVVAWLGMGALILALLQKRRLIIQVPDDLKQIEKNKPQSKQEKSS